MAVFSWYTPNLILCAGPGNDQRFASIVQRQVRYIRNVAMAVQIRLEALCLNG